MSRDTRDTSTHCWAVPEDLCFSWPTSRAVPPWSRWWPSVAWPVPGTGSDQPGTAAPGTTSRSQTKDVLVFFARGKGWERGWEIKFCSNTLMMWDKTFYKACQFIYICNWDKLLKPWGLKDLRIFHVTKNFERWQNSFINVSLICTFIKLLKNIINLLSRQCFLLPNHIKLAVNKMMKYWNVSFLNKSNLSNNHFNHSVVNCLVNCYSARFKFRTSFLPFEYLIYPAKVKVLAIIKLLCL